MATEEKSSVLIDHPLTVTWRSAANWAAWISVILPDILGWVLSHLDAVPAEMLSMENKNIARIVLVSIAVPIARVIRQRALQKALDKKALEAVGNA